MKIGFSGTTSGMSSYQENWVRSLLMSYEASVVFHSYQPGAEKQFFDICREAGVKQIICRLASSGEITDSEDVAVHGPADEDTKNEILTRGCDMVIACPKDYDVACSTWATIRKCRLHGVKLAIVPRDAE